MLRTVAMSLILLLSVGVMLPFAQEAHGLRQSAVTMRRNHRYHSRAWWRRYRARLRKKRAAAALAHRNVTLGVPQNIPVGNLTNAELTNIISALPTVESEAPAAPVQVVLPRAASRMVLANNSSLTLPAVAPSEAPAAPAMVVLPRAASRMALPKDNSRITLPTQQSNMSPDGAPSPMSLTVKSSAKTLSTVPATTTTTNVSDTKATVKSLPAPKLPGQMNLTVVALSRPNPVFLTPREQSKMLGGTSVSDLRRLVIDKMINTGGWVTNDYVREINGARVFVVTAHTPKDKNSPEKAWTFYFTESDGRIYGLTTDAPLDSAERMSTEAERFINKLQSTSQPNNR